MSRKLKFGEPSADNSAVIYFVSFFSGLLLSFAFPGRDIPLVAWIAVAPFIYYSAESSPRTSFRAGLAFGIPFFFGTQYWIYYSINHYGNMHLIFSLAIILLLCIYESLYIGIFAVLASYLSRRTYFPMLLIAPSIWVCMEFIRGFMFTGFPWSLVGYTQYGSLPLIQISDITGVYGVSFLVVAVNAAIADVLLLRKKRKLTPLYPTIPVYIGISTLAILLVASLIYGNIRLKETQSTNSIKVAIVQGNIDQNKKWEKAYQSSVFSTYIELTKKVSREGPDLIVWPETSVPFIFGSDKEFTSRLQDFQQSNRIPLLFGSILVRSKDDKGYKLTNSAVLLDKNANIAYRYDKVHLVPFGEYVPLGRILFFVERLAEGIGAYVPGTELRSAETSFGTFSTAICYELIFPSLVRNFFQSGGDILITITNDAWFGNTIGPVQHFYTSVFRAVENRKPVIRAANTGISGYIDSRGMVVKKTDLFKSDAIVVDLIKNDKKTFYTKYGDIFIYICLLTVTIILINQIFHKKNPTGGKQWQ
ncbi:MAG: apolipoprotein N-acyltransferase [Nitrospirota bacterium]|nr:MAG: apolipoprotein N-acyltransferase [Nitrospirota bacterium]